MKIRLTDSLARRSRQYDAQIEEVDGVPVVTVDGRRLEWRDAITQQIEIVAMPHDAKQRELFDKWMEETT